ncbi:DUF748 domain-containing protein [Aestuariicella hydrocarbonica]|uniref:DUF748 domain-containing protein n=2 Tax=Pseudomaricurvus hydrocarbonicus TaxID=1470433 RepID=A0A9E5MPJ5_9GAMM|nr:DUF748 domain-containing protein [Aestuariicella hydrocarbonica]
MGTGNDRPQASSSLASNPDASPLDATPDDKSAEPNPPAGAAVPVLIKKITLGPDVLAKVSDRGVKPAFVEKLQLNALELTDVSLTDRQLPSTVLLDMRLSNDATVKAEGQFNVASKSTDLELAVEGYQLLSLSGYSSQFTGYALESGVFNLTSSVKVADNVMDTKNQAIMHHISLRPEQTDQVEKFAHQLTMPLDQALDLLRDSDDQIKLNVPVKGALNDPDVDIQQVINKALGGAMKKASMLVLKSLLQPYGAIITVAQMAGEKMTEVHLDPIVFDAGSVELNSVAKDYSGKIAAMVNDREALTLKLCGVTNSQDAQFLVTTAGAAAPGQDTTTAVADEARVASQAQQSEPQVLSQQQLQQQAQQQRERLDQLGADRTQAVKQYLQTTLNVKPRQLLVCLPEHRDKADAPSGVVLSI